METVYSKKPFAESENNKLIAERDASVSICTTFDIYCGEENGMWGIWMDVDEKKYMVDPISLVDSLYRDGWYFGLLTYHSEGHKTRKDVHVRKDEYYITWTLGLGISADQHPRHFNFDDYLGRVRQCVNEFHKAVQEGRPLGERDMSENKDIEIAVKQLGVKGVAPGYYRVMSSWIKKEEFVFHFDPTDKDCETFTIGIGDRQYVANLPHEDNDYEVIRHQFESLAFSNEATIELIDCLDETQVKIRRKSVLKEITDKGEGFSFDYEDYALVEIWPHEYQDAPIIKGYCDLKQTIQTLYESFLLLAMYHDEIEKDAYEPSRIEAYNMFKSPIIERTIAGSRRSNHTHAAKRQTRVKEILIIEPDVDALFWDCEGAVTDIPQKYVTDEVAELVAQMEKWAYEIRPAIVADVLGKPHTFDWADYHSRGLVLAQRLRLCLPDEVDLWYYTPVEDHSGIQPPKQLIYYTQL